MAMPDPSSCILMKKKRMPNAPASVGRSLHANFTSYRSFLDILRDLRNHSTQGGWPNLLHSLDSDARTDDTTPIGQRRVTILDLGCLVLDGFQRRGFWFDGLCAFHLPTWRPRSAPLRRPRLRIPGLIGSKSRSWREQHNCGPSFRTTAPDELPACAVCPRRR
jgi:hypothetical protein